MIKMLTSIAADGFALSPNEVTGIFTKKEQENFISAGLAIEATAEEVKTCKAKYAAEKAELKKAHEVAKADSDRLAKEAADQEES